MLDRLKARIRRKKLAADHPLPSTMTNAGLATNVESMIARFDPNTRRLFLIGYSDLISTVEKANEIATETGEPPQNTDNLINAMIDGVAHGACDEPVEGYREQRLFYLYLSTLLIELETRAEKDESIWESVSRCWAPLVDCIPELQETVATTALWHQDEMLLVKEWPPVTQEDLGVLLVLMPHELRGYQAIEQALVRLPSKNREETIV